MTKANVISVKTPQYIGICLFPATSFAKQLNVKLATFLPDLLLKRHPRPHVTILYAPLSYGSTVDDAVEKFDQYCAQQTEPAFPKEVRINEVYTTSFGTINLAIGAIELLRSLHCQLVEILQQHLHSDFLQAFRHQIDKQLFATIKTTNIGINYKPHLTLGFIDQSKVMDLGAINRSLREQRFCCHASINDATGSSLQEIRRLG